MIRGYGNTGQAGRSYIGAIAELLMKYPRSVALACADPHKGVAVTTKFLPTPADIVPWCEKACAPMYEEAQREKNISAQLDERAAWENYTIPAWLKAMGAAWLNRTDSVAAQLVGGTEADEQARREAARAAIETSNRTAFLRECAADGVDPTRGVSPALLKTLGGSDAEIR